MNRRSFFHSAIAAASALSVDPERLLWAPGSKTIFIPPAPKVACSIIEAAGPNVTLLAGESYYQIHPTSPFVKFNPLPNAVLNIGQIDLKRVFINMGCADGVMFFRTAKGLFLKNTKSRTAFVRMRPDGTPEVTRPIPH